MQLNKHIYRNILFTINLYNLFTLGNFKKFFLNDLVCNGQNKFIYQIKFINKFLCLYYDVNFSEQHIYIIFVTFFSIVFFLFCIKNFSKKNIYITSVFYFFHNILLFLELRIYLFLIISLTYVFIILWFRFSNRDIFEIKFEILYTIFFVNFIQFLNPYYSTIKNNYLIDRHTFNEFLISYSGSFHRRGAIGSILTLISSDKDSLILNAYLLMIIFELVLLFLIFNLLKKTNQSLKFILLFSPLGLFFHIKLEEFGRKDVLILILFLLFLNSLQNIKLNSLILLIFGIFVMLSHEGLFFYLSFYYLANYRYKKELGKNQQFNSIDLIISFLLMLGLSLLTVFSKLRITVTEYDLYLKSKNISNLNNTALNYLSQDFSYYLSEVKQKITFEILSYWIILIIFILYLTYQLSNNIGHKNYSWLNFIVVIPLFIAQDWGRWLYLFFMHFLILEIYFINRYNFKFEFRKLLVLVFVIFSLTSIPSGPQQETYYEYEMKFKINIHRYITENFFGIFEYGMYKY